MRLPMRDLRRLTGARRGEGEEGVASRIQSVGFWWAVGWMSLVLVDGEHTVHEEELMPLVWNGEMEMEKCLDLDVVKAP